MTRHHVHEQPPLPEQRCVAPGHWVIGGWEVRRHGDARRPRYWQASKPGQRDLIHATLGLVRAEIRDRTPHEQETRSP